MWNFPVRLLSFKFPGYLWSVDKVKSLGVNCYQIRIFTSVTEHQRGEDSIIRTLYLNNHRQSLLHFLRFALNHTFDLLHSNSFCRMNANSGSNIYGISINAHYLPTLANLISPQHPQYLATPLSRLSS